MAAAAVKLGEKVDEPNDDGNGNEHAADDNLGARIGAAFDWVRGTVDSTVWSRTDIHVPGLPSTVIPVGPFRENDHFTEFVTQAALGLQTTYLLTDSVGLYANVGYRCGGNATFEKGGERYAELKLDGWCVGAGVVLAF